MSDAVKYEKNGFGKEMTDYPYGFVALSSVAGLAVGVASSWLWASTVKFVYPRIGMPSRQRMGPIRVMSTWAPWMMGAGAVGITLGLILQGADITGAQALYTLGWGLLVGFAWARASMMIVAKKGLLPTDQGEVKAGFAGLRPLPVVRTLMLAYLLFSIVGATAYVLIPKIREPSANWLSFLGTWVVLGSFWAILEVRHMRKRGAPPPPNPRQA